MSTQAASANVLALPALDLSGLKPADAARLRSTCTYTRKGSIPPTVVTRQQLIDDILLRGFDMREAVTRRADGRMVCLNLKNAATGQFYQFKHKAEIAYAELRLPQVLSARNEPAKALRTESEQRGANPVLPAITDQGWREGEEVSALLPDASGKTHRVKGRLFIASNQRWRVRLTDLDGAPQGMKLGQSLPALSNWTRSRDLAAVRQPEPPEVKATVVPPVAAEAVVPVLPVVPVVPPVAAPVAVVPVAVVAPPVAAAGVGGAVAVEPPVAAAVGPVVAVVPPVAAGRALPGAEVSGPARSEAPGALVRLDLTTGGQLFGRIFARRTAEGAQELRVRLVRLEGAVDAGTYVRGMDLPLGPDWVHPDAIRVAVGAVVDAKPDAKQSEPASPVSPESAPESALPVAPEAEPATPTVVPVAPEAVALPDAPAIPAPEPAAAVAVAESDPLAVALAEPATTTLAAQFGLSAEPGLLIARHFPEAGPETTVLVLGRSADDKGRFRVIGIGADLGPLAGAAEFAAAGDRLVVSSVAQAGQTELRPTPKSVLLAVKNLVLSAEKDCEPEEATKLAALLAAAQAGDRAGLLVSLEDPGVGLILGGATSYLRALAFALPAPDRAPAARNFTFAPGTRLAPRSVGARTRANLDAIRLLNELRDAGRLATPEEKVRLAAFSGWGSMKSIFATAPAAIVEEIREAFIKDKGRISYYDYEKFRDYRPRQTEPFATFEEYFRAYLVQNQGVEPGDLPGGPADAEAENENENANDEDESENSGLSYAERRIAAFRWYRTYGKARDELKELLGATEFARAALSTLNAHYTDEMVCFALWDAAKNLGFEGGTVLEPASGSGRIVSAMPPELRSVCKVVGSEKDEFTARLAQALLPEAKIHACAFEDAPVAPGSVDLVISNVPFSDVKTNGTEFSLHNWFIAESMKKLRPGGLGVIITTSNSLDSNVAQRKALAEVTELVDAIRLPNDAFRASSGTDVTTDIWLYRKPSQELAPVGETFSGVLPVTIAEDQRPAKLGGNDALYAKEGDVEATRTAINEYYVRRPEMVLGQHSLRGKMYGGPRLAGQYTVVTPKGETRTLAERLAGAVAKVRRVPNTTQRARVTLSSDELQAERIDALKSEKSGSLAVRDGKLYRVAANRELTPWQPADEAVAKNPAASAALAKMGADFVPLRDAYLALIVADLSATTTPETSAALRAKTAARYEEFRAAYGPLNEPRTRKRLRDAAGNDPDLFTVLALEAVEKKIVNGKPVATFERAKVLSERTLFPRLAPAKADSLLDAAKLSIAEYGRLELGYMAQLLGRGAVTGAQEIRDELLDQRLAFRDPAGGSPIYKDFYLTGDVVGKLDAARLAAVQDAAFLANVAALAAVAPAPVSIRNVRAQMSSGWLPESALRAFLQQVCGLERSARVTYDSKENSWMTVPERPYYNPSPEAAAKFATQSRSISAMVNAQFKGSEPVVKVEMENGSKVIDEVATSAAVTAYRALAARFTEWILEPANVVHADAIALTFNQTYNRTVLTNWDGSALTFPGLAQGSFVPMPHQKDVVMRNCITMQGITAHGVGFGKTLEMILTIFELKRMGRANKCLLVCDNANYEQVVQTTRSCYPQARILHAEPDDLTPQQRPFFVARMAANDWDIILMSRAQFGKIPVSPEKETAYYLAQVADLETGEDDMKSGAARRQLKVKEKMLEKAETRIRARKLKGDTTMAFEQIGVDFIYVDESHRHKKIGFASRFADVKGIDTGASTRGVDLLLKARHIQELHGNGRGVIGATGTPGTNTMAEFHTAATIFAPNINVQFRVPHIDNFITTFCVAESKLELNEANGRWRMNERFRRFINGPTFASYIRSFCDLKLDATVIGLKRPKHESGNIELGVAPLTYCTHSGQEQIAACYKWWEELDREDKMAMGWVPVVLMALNVALAVDPRLVDRNAPVGKDALLDGVCDEIARIYREKNKAGEPITHGQVVFLDRRNTMNTPLRINLSDKQFTKEAMAQGFQAALALQQDKQGVEEDTTVERRDFDEEEDEAPAESVAKQGKAQKGAADAEPEAGEGEGFNAWEEIRRGLIARGIPADKIAVVSDAKNAKAKSVLFDRMDGGDLAVIVGSSDTLGIGCNFQKRLYAAHHVDPARTYTPDVMDQRNGRILRQGNRHEAVRVIYYGMADTCTPAVYNRLQFKAAFLAQAYSEGVGVEFEESSDMRLEEMKSMLLSDKRQQRRQELLDTIRALKVQEAAQRRQRDNCEATIKYLKSDIAIQQAQSGRAQAHAAWFTANLPYPGGESFDPDRAGETVWRCEFVSRKSALTDAESAVLAKAELKPNAAGAYDLGGPPQAVLKKLDALIQAWRTQENVHTIGTVTLNGLQLNLLMEQTFGEKWKLLVRYYDPVNPVDKDGRANLFSAGNFLTTDGLLGFARMVVSMPATEMDKIAAKIVRNQQDIRQQEGVLTHLPVVIGDAEQSKALVELSALEKDMKEKPFVMNLPPPGTAKRCAMKFDCGAMRAAGGAQATLPEPGASTETGPVAPVLASAAVLAAPNRIPEVAPKR